MGILWAHTGAIECKVLNLDQQPKVARLCVYVRAHGSKVCDVSCLSEYECWVNHRSQRLIDFWFMWCEVIIQKPQVTNHLVTC